MQISTLTKLVGTAMATTVASVALAAPSAALVVPDPIDSTGTYQQQEPTAASSDGIPWTEVGLGALAALTVVGLAAAAAGTRQRRHHPAPQA